MIDDDQSNILTKIGLWLIVVSLLLQVRQINLPFCIMMIWFFCGSLVSHIIINKMVKHEYVAVRLSICLYLVGFITALYWYNPRHIVVGPMLCIVGLMFNMVVESVNNGKMPVCCPQTEITDTHTYVKMGKIGASKTKLNILGDWIPFFDDSLASPGDCLMDIGPLVTALEIFLFF